MFNDAHLFDVPPKDIREIDSYERLGRLEKKMDKIISLLEKIANRPSDSEYRHNYNGDWALQILNLFTLSYIINIYERD